MSNKLCAIILSGGKGNRMSSNITKQQLLVCGKSVLYHAVKAFADCNDVSFIVVVSRCGEEDFVKGETRMFNKEIHVVTGGATRAQSAKNGFEYAKRLGADFVAVHDSARCLVTPEIISAVYGDAIKYGAATASTAVTDSIKSVDGSSFVLNSVDRDSLRIMQTPQIFKSDLYESALCVCDTNDKTITDDNSMLERIGVKVFCTETGRENVKLTVKEDLSYAEFIMKCRGES